MAKINYTGNQAPLQCGGATRRPSTPAEGNKQLVDNLNKYYCSTTATDTTQSVLFTPLVSLHTNGCSSSSLTLRLLKFAEDITASLGVVIMVNPSMLKTEEMTVDLRRHSLSLPTVSTVETSTFF